MIMYLAGSQDNRHHAFGLSGLHGLVNQNAGKFNAGQADITGTDAGTSNHIGSFQ